MPPCFLFVLLITSLFGVASVVNAKESGIVSPDIPSPNTLQYSAEHSSFDDVDSPIKPQSKTTPLKEKLIIDSLASFFKVISTANKIVNYRSLMTYEANGFITTYRLLHKVKDNIVDEQLIFMDGPRRQVVRRQNLRACLNGATRWGLWPTILSESSLKAYTLEVQRVERIAGREAIVFTISPKDSLRYGYEYSIDKETGLLLRVVTYHNKIILERLQTVAIEFSNPDAIVELANTSDYVWRVPEAEPCHTEQFEPAWRAGWLPEGFVSVGNRITAQGEQVLMFADGLVSISVFIIKQGAGDLPIARARHGATVVVITPESPRSTKSIAVVGEIPTVTAQRIAVSIKPI